MHAGQTQMIDARRDSPVRGKIVSVHVDYRDNHELFEMVDADSIH
jgi:hypothetical protein